LPEHLQIVDAIRNPSSQLAYLKPDALG